MRAPDPEEISAIGDNLPAWFTQAMSVPRAEGFVDIAGCPIHWLRWGREDKPPVVFLHGFLAHARCWAFIAPLLADKFDLIAFDLSGMGESGERDKYKVRGRASELAEFVAAMNFAAKPFIVAHSYGGGVAIHTQEMFPDAFRGVLVCDTMMLRPEDVEAFMARSHQMSSNSSGKRRIYPDWQSAYSRYRLSPEQPCNHDFLFEYLAKHSIKKIDEGWTWKFDPKILLRDAEEQHWWIDNADCFARLPAPKGIIYGEKSLLFGGGITEYLREKSAAPFPIVTIPDAHHHVMLDQPIALATAIDGILSSWAAGS